MNKALAFAAALATAANAYSINGHLLGKLYLCVGVAYLIIHLHHKFFSCKCRTEPVAPE